MIDRALIMLPEWADIILKGYKTWEIRNRNTNIRGRIGLIAKGTKAIVGEVDIVDSFPLTKGLFENNVHRHRLLCTYEQLPQNYKYVWVLENPVLYDIPVRYEHPKGAQVWVKL